MDRQLRQFVSRQTVLKGTVVIGPRITPITLRAVEETSTMYKMRAASTSRFETNSASPWRTKLDNILLIRVLAGVLAAVVFVILVFRMKKKAPR